MQTIYYPCCLYASSATVCTCSPRDMQHSAPCLSCFRPLALKIGCMSSQERFGEFKHRLVGILQSMEETTSEFEAAMNKLWARFCAEFEEAESLKQVPSHF